MEIFHASELEEALSPVHVRSFEKRDTVFCWAGGKAVIRDMRRRGLHPEQCVMNREQDAMFPACFGHGGGQILEVKKLGEKGLLAFQKGCQTGLILG